MKTPMIHHAIHGASTALGIVAERLKQHVTDNDIPPDKQARVRNVVATMIRCVDELDAIREELKSDPLNPKGPQG